MNEPMKIASNITGNRVSSRRPTPRGRQRHPILGRRVSSLEFTFCSIAPHSLDCRDQVLVPPLRAELGHKSPFEEHQNPIADDQLIQVIGYDQDGGAGRPSCSTMLNSALFDAISTPCVGLTRTSSRGPAASARPNTDFC